MKKGIYKHYKGNLYELIGTANHSETLEKMVIYKALYGSGGVWVRPAGMWGETIICNGVSVPRFAYVEDIITFEKSCGAICYRINENEKIEYLVLHQHKSGTWSVPKGHMEPGETQVGTAEREVFEETGIRIKIDTGFSKKLSYVLHNGNVKCVTLFLAELKENPEIDGSEISEFKWVCLNDAIKVLPDVGYDEIICDAEIYINSCL